MPIPVLVVYSLHFLWSCWKWLTLNSSPEDPPCIPRVRSILKTSCPVLTDNAVLSVFSKLLGGSNSFSIYMYIKQTKSFVSKHNNQHNYKLPCAGDILNYFVKREGELFLHIKVCLQVLGSWLYQYGCENVVKSYCGSRGSCVKFNSLPKMMSHESAWPGAEGYFQSTA